MKTVKIPTCWTAEQADSIYRFIQAIQDNIWQTYNEELQRHYRQKQGISLKSEVADEPNGELDRLMTKYRFEKIING